MTRRIVWISVALLVLFGLGTAWFLTEFEQVPVKHRVKEQAEARRNPYLALERFLAGLGRPVARVKNAQALDELPAGGVLILDRQRRQHMGPARVERLLTWVETGGYLIVTPELVRVEDPLLDELEVERAWPDADSQPQDDDQDDQQNDGGRTPKRKLQLPKLVSVSLPGMEKPLRLAFRAPPLHVGDVEPEWQAGHEEVGDQVLHFSLGDGYLTVVAGLDSLLDNRHIGQQDHAELIWALLAAYSPDPAAPVVLAADLSVPDLWDWLAGPGLTALVAGLACLGLWLWRTVPRFGPPLPPPVPDRRELREHLAALGRYLWRAGGLDQWLTAARETFLARLALRHPALAALPPAEQAEALARMSHRSQSLIAAALHQPAATPHAFTTALRTLRNLQRTL